MKFICQGTDFYEAVVKTIKACAVRTTAPILECVKLSALNEGCELFATDGELSILKSFHAEVFEEGEICVPGKLLADFLGKLTETQLTIQTGERGLEICYGDCVTAMQALSSEEFPKLDLEVGENSFVLKRRDLKRIVAKTCFCCAQDDSRPILKGCLFECKDKLEATALDGYRLALASADLTYKNKEISAIVPSRTLIEIARMISDDDGEATIYTQGGMLLAKDGDMTILSRLYQGEFIRKESVIPPEFTTEVTIKRADLISSAERASVLIRGDRNNLITLEIGANAVKVKSDSEMGKVAEVLSAKISGKDLVISMNSKFLLEALKVLEEETVQLSFNGPLSPFILQNTNQKESLYLILPVRNVQ